MIFTILHGTIIGGGREGRKERGREFRKDGEEDGMIDEESNT